MGLFSFGKKDEAPRRRGANANPARGARGEAAARRTRRTESAGDASAMLLDPTLPEKQRARRRLVGAIALVIAAVVVLPMVLDSHPKPVTDDIAIDIPNRSLNPARTTVDEDAQAGVAPDNPAAPAELAGTSGSVPAAPQAAANGANPAAAGASNGQANQPAAQPLANPASNPSKQPAQAGKPAANGGAAAQARATPRSSPAPAAPSTHAAKQVAPGGAVAVTPSPADADSGTPAAPPGARFAVQLGSFPDDASAHNWVTKLKAAGVPAYIERRKEADGKMRTLLRAGPFADRAAASAAIAKVREVGLTANAAAGAAQ